MAELVQTQLRKFDQLVKPYLYEGPLSSKFSLLEQKTPVKRERFALGRIALLSLNYF